jgi:hypothetical protein
MDELQQIQDKYTRSVNMLPWTPQIKAQATTQVENAKRAVESNLNTGTSLVESVVRGVGGAQQQLNKSRAAVQQGLASVQATAADTSKRVKQIVIDPIQQQIATAKQQIAQEKEKQAKSDSVYKLRKEQTAALNSKYAANLHTSWLGLWRPLQDQTRAILATAAVVFGLLTVVIVAYFSYGAIVARLSGGGGAAAADAVGTVTGSLTDYVNNFGNNTIQSANSAFKNLVGGTRSRK